MRKCVALFLAVLCLSALLVMPAMAVGSPSASTDSVNQATTTTAGVTASIDTTKADAKAQTAQKAEVEKLAAAESPKAYFGTVKDADGKEVDLEALLGTKDLKVLEMQPLVISGYDKATGELPIVLTFATPYEKGAKVVVMIGFVTDNGVEWIAVEGVGTDKGGIEFKLPAEIAERVQNETTLVAPVSK